MARTHARLLVSLWNDPDWLALTSQQHDVYTALLTTHDLSWCGVAPLLPQRIVMWSSDLTARKVQTALDVLASHEAGRFLVIDETTAEVSVRTFVRHDDLLKQPNVVKAMLAALDRVRSRTLRDAIVHELRRMRQEAPDLHGWDVIRSRDPELFAEVATNPLRRAS
jgi:hypothetical protein